MKKTIDDINVRGCRVLVRLDLNVPLDDAGRITDDRRISASLPTVRKLLDGGGRLILMSHLGRPEGNPNARTKSTLAPVAKRLGELLNRPVRMLPDCVGPAVTDAMSSMKDGDICLLENLRFHQAEQIKDKKAADDPRLREQKESFAKAIADLGDVYVNDAFGTCHRDNASMLTVPRLMAGRPRVVGYLVQKELQFLGQAVSDPKRPFVCILGGAKVSDKLGAIKSLLARCDTVLIGGAMAYTFLAADGIEVGRSLVEPDLYDNARDIRRAAGDRLRLPVDSVAAEKIERGIETKTCDGSVPAGLMGLDIGPKTIHAYSRALADAKTVVWNGPMGVFETPPFDCGTLAIAEALAAATDRGAITVVGGGDSAAAVEQAGISDRITHVSTGGGASLEFLEGA
jgi:phosphoglycerate kinase